MKHIAELLNQKPILGAWAGFAGFGSAVLAWLKVISIVFGAGGAVVGFIVACYALRNQRRWAKEHTTKTPPPES